MFLCGSVHNMSQKNMEIAGSTQGQPTKRFCQRKHMKPCKHMENHVFSMEFYNPSYISNSYVQSSAIEGKFIWITQKMCTFDGAFYSYTSKCIYTQYTYTIHFSAFSLHSWCNSIKPKIQVGCKGLLPSGTPYTPFVHI